MKQDCELLKKSLTLQWISRIVKILQKLSALPGRYDPVIEVV